MKANHNLKFKFLIEDVVVFNISKIQDESKSQPYTQLLTRTLVVFNISKIQDESKSQPQLNGEAAKSGCFQYFKDTR